MSSNLMQPLNASFPDDELFDWYDAHGRNLPWRHWWPSLAPVYHLWLSEIMLQQTIVKTVIPYFLEFTRRWPTIESLAAAALDDVLAAWAGLHYMHGRATCIKLHELFWRSMAAISQQIKRHFSPCRALARIPPVRLW